MTSHDGVTVIGTNTPPQARRHGSPTYEVMNENTIGSRGIKRAPPEVNV